MSLAACSRLCCRDSASGGVFARRVRSSAWSTYAIVPVRYRLFLAFLVWKHFLSFDLLMFEVRNLGKLWIEIMYLLAKLPRQYQRNHCHHLMSEPFLSCLSRALLSREQFFGEDHMPKIFLHLPSVYGDKCLEEIYKVLSRDFCTYLFWWFDKYSESEKLSNNFFRNPFRFFFKIFSTSGRIWLRNRAW